MEQTCFEQLLSDVIRVDLVLASECHFTIPCQVALTEMAVANLSDWTPQSTSHAVIGQAKLSVAFDVQDGDDGLMEEAPKLTRTPKTTAAGLVNTLALDVPIMGGFEATRIAAELLHRRDFHALLTTVEGTRYLLYSVPGSCECLLKGTDINKMDTLTATMQSSSQMIRLTQAQ